MIYNPLYKQYKSITGAIPSETPTTFRVKNIFDSVLLVVQKDGQDHYEVFTMEKRENFFEVTISLNKGLYFYYFKVEENKYLSKGNSFDGVVTDEINKYQLTVYSNKYTSPEWIKGGVIYQIFPDRFNSSGLNFKPQDGKILREDWGGIPFYKPNEQGEVLNNDFFGGDLKGITQKLDYLSSLNVTCIYLNPIFKAYSNHRYDTGNYLEIDPLLGNLDDLKDLIDNANKYGLKIILDGVFNHTGSNSLYFNKDLEYDDVGAYQSKNSKYYSWFNFIKYPNEYESWWGIKTLPSTNKSKGGYRDFITKENGVVDFYTKLGIGGWRLDVVDEIPTDFSKDITSAVKKVNNQAIVIGEVWEDASNKISYGVRREYFQGEELDSVMNYPLKNAIIDFVKNGNSENLVNVINTQIDHYPKAVLHSLMNILSTHDTFRLLSALSNVDVDGKTKEEQSKISIYGEELDIAKFRVKVASLLQYTLCGVPSVYYGDEIGMQGFVDPLNRACFDWENGDSDLTSWYKLLGNIRKEYSCLKDGDFELVYFSQGSLVYKRLGEKELLIAVNLSNEHLFLDYDGTLIDIISNKEFKNQIQLENNSIMVLVCK